MRSTFHFEIPAFCSIPLRLAVYESKSTLCVNSLRLLLLVVCSKCRKVRAKITLKSKPHPAIFCFPSPPFFLSWSMHYVCIFIFSHPVSSASLFPPWVQPTCWWRSFVFSRLQPALVTRFDLTYPGVTAANYLASLWSLLNVSIFPRCFLVVDVVVFVVVVHPCSGTLRLCQCSDTVWHPHEILQRV